ncbi:hypothetical protein ACH4TV_26565 [Streptomyces sp. NPDC020898]|uniref:hypothetical protein n=1 Tax=Streptomyces sp. NPDC020898 TaxID=3365101 RepID=UPI00379A9048
MNGDDTTGRLAGLLAAALREGTAQGQGQGESEGTGDGGERDAVAAFLLARDSGAHKVARTRRRDDWRR